MTLPNLINGYQDLSRKFHGILDRYMGSYAFLQEVSVQVDRLLDILLELQIQINNIGKEPLQANQLALDNVRCACEDTLVTLSSQIDGLCSSGLLRWVPFASTFKYLLAKYASDWRLKSLQQHQADIRSLLERLGKIASSQGRKDHDEGFVHIQDDDFADTEFPSMEFSNSTQISSGNEMAMTNGPSTLADLLNKIHPVNLTGKVGLKHGPPIAFGSFSSVHHAVLDRKQVVVKIAKARRRQTLDVAWEDELEKGLRDVIRWWTALSHPNILELLGYADDIGDFPVMVSPWYKHRDAFQYLSATPSLSSEQRLGLTRDVANGLAYLHSYGVVHGDIKPKNVIINDDNDAKLCDFGLYELSNKYSPTGMTETSPYGERERYKAPELFPSRKSRHPQPTFATDIYSLGCIAYYFVLQRQPYYDLETLYEVLDAIKEEEPPGSKPEDLQTQADVQFWEFLEACWAHNPTLRPTAMESVSMLSHVHIA